MKPQLKRVHSPDANELDDFAPADADRFGLLIQLMIGPENEEGEESFDIVVCSTRWLGERASESDVVDLRHHLLVAKYNWTTLVDYIERFLADIDEESWQAVALRVGRLGRWEYEDYDQ